MYFSKDADAIPTFEFPGSTGAGPRQGTYLKDQMIGILFLFLGVWASLVVRVVKNLPANARDVGDLGSIPGSGRSPGGGHSKPLQYSTIHIFPFDSMLNTSPIWCLP